MYYEHCDIVDVLFPYSDKPKFKQRPALLTVPNSQYKIPTYSVYQITSTQKYGNFILHIPEDYKYFGKTGLITASYIDFRKHASIEENLIIKKRGLYYDKNRINKFLKELHSY